jgi:hypothetical protein
MKPVLITLLFLNISFCINAQEAKSNKQQTKKDTALYQFQYFVVKTDSSTFGYDIYTNGNLYIHQTTVPGMSGNSGFENTALAKKCALLVLKKLEKGEALPTITEEELIELGLKKK